MSRLASALGLAAVAAFSLYLTAPTLEFGFAYDDHANIVERPAAWREGWGRFFATRHWGTGRHASLLSFDLDRREPLDPRPFHVTNAMLAALASCLLVLIASAIGVAPAGALAAGFLFAAHPVHADAVAAIAGRAELLAACGVLGCVALHARGYPGGALARIGAALAFLLALASKESAVALLPLLCAHDLWPGRSHGARRFDPAAYATYTVVLAAWLTLTLPRLAEISPIIFVDNPLAYDAWYVRAARAAYVLGEYLRTVVWPVELRPDYSYAVLVPSPGAGIAAAGAWATLGTACLLVGRRQPALAFAVAWFPLAFVATSNIVFPIGTIMAERLVYLPSAGACLMAGWLIAVAAARGRVARLVTGVATVVSVLAFGFAFEARARIWTSDEHYHVTVAVVSPRSAKAHYNLGLLRARQHRLEDAVDSLRRAVAIHPAFERATYYLAGALGELGRKDEAAATYRAFLREVPDHSAAMSQLIQIELDRGDADAALEIARRLVQIEPDQPQHRLTLVLVEQRALAVDQPAAPTLSP